MCSHHSTGEMEPAKFVGNVHVIAVRTFCSAATCLCCGDAVAPIEKDISECVSCHAVQLTEECGRSVSAKVCLKNDELSRMWIHDKNLCEMVESSSKAITKAKILLC